MRGSWWRVRRPIARLIFNDRLDAVVTGVLIVMVSLVLIESALEWARVLVRQQAGRGKGVVRSWRPASPPRSRDEAGS